MADCQEPGASKANSGENALNQSDVVTKPKRTYNRRRYRPKRKPTSSTESNTTPDGNLKEENTNKTPDGNLKEKYTHRAKKTENTYTDTAPKHVNINSGCNYHYSQLGARPKSTYVVGQPCNNVRRHSTAGNMVFVNSNRAYNIAHTPEKMNKRDFHSGKEKEKVRAERHYTKTPPKSQVQDNQNNEKSNINIKSNEDKISNKENNSERKRKKKTNARVTHLYIVSKEDFVCVNVIKGFLKHRMGNPKLVDFDVIGFTDGNMKTKQGCVIDIRFESYQKSSAARHLLNLSNKNASSKLHCYYDKLEAEGKQKQTGDNNKSKLEYAFIEIVDKVSDMLEKHNMKIQSVEENLEGVQKQLGRRRGVSLNEFETLSYEKDAYIDKLQEFEGQKSEFLNYVKSMNDKLKTIITHEKFDNELKEVRRYFGVECQRLLSALPIYARREDILTTVAENLVCVILGETGSGKSTQMAQYIYEAGFADNGIIACTQPRKIAAISLATKVSSELASSVGQVVGYKVGMQSKTTAVTKVIYMTDHILLNECLSDRDLMRYSCIIIDEAHERSIHTDLLLGMLKQCLEKRPELRVVITSATIDAQLFVDFFEGRCPVLKVSGRTFPVDVAWNSDDYFDSPFPEDYEEKALRKAIELHTTMPVDAGDILVFLTAASETEKAVEKFKKRIGEKDAQCLQMHGRLKPEEQQLVLAPTLAGKRKVVFATNNAETSLTIPGVTFVVDSGVVKEMVFDPKKNINSLNVVRISQSSANQRKGRAGRTRPGLCYRLYMEKDFHCMDTISKPEILRVRVSQALLKLMDFGIDPMEFQYVQAPSADSMKSALDELTQLGAIVDNRLTDLGQWISKVPLEPRLGAFVKKGIDRNVLSEVLVVASCSSQNGLFFRVGSPEEKKTADMKKVRFCHFGGDLLTMLNVYREWDQINEKKKGKWCVDNCINGKSVKAVRDMMNEIIFILRKEYNMQIKHSFGKPETVDSDVQKLIFKCMTSNLGYFLGHEKAGYMITDRLQKVQLHPSSSLHSLGLNPTWIVFSKVLRTSDDFLTDVTPVPEADVLEEINVGRLNVDVQSLERQKVQSSLKVSVGRHVFWKFVGSMHANRRKVEDDISRSCDNSMVVIEANKQKGEITLFSVPEYEHITTALLKAILDEMPEQLLLESREDIIGNDRSGIRAVMRSGGCVYDILMPNQFRSFTIRQKDESWMINEDAMRDMLEFYGPVESIWVATGKKQQRHCWGRATFTHGVDAEAAVNYINEDDDSEIYTIPLKYENQRTSNQRKQEFTMRLTWWRRKARGHCFVHLSCPEDLAPLVSTSFELDGSDVDIKLARNNTDLFLEGIGPETMEEDIKRCLAELLGLPENRCIDRFGVVIPRQNVTWSENEKYDLQYVLSYLISDLTNTPEDKFRVHIRDFKPKTVMCVAFVAFDDPEMFQRTGERLIDNNAKINESDIHVSLECKSSVHVDKNLHPIVSQDLDDMIKTLNRSSPCIEKKVLKSGAVVLNINASSANHLAKVKVNVDRVVGGDILECENTENLHVLFSSSGRQTAKRIEHTTKTLIYVDERNMKVTVQGLRKGRKEALVMIQEFLSSYDNAVEKITRLKGEDLPTGLMKALLVKYGIGFKTLLDESGVSRVQLNLRDHHVTIIGTEEAVSKALEIIEGIRQEITTEPVSECDAPDCPICLCPVEEHDISRLEYCGHAYCSVCLISMIQNAVMHKEFPVKCAMEGCNQPLVIRDFNGMIKIGKLKPAALLDASLACFVSSNKDRYRFCITPDCAMVYGVSLESDGEMFVCPTCRVKICTACHLPYHDGITCAMYKSAKKDGDSVVKWLSEDTANRKLCPKCSARIEKDGGCQHVHCTECKAHICWLCLKYFGSSGLCYGHLSKAHGSFV